jgi:ATP-binding protein involved in chromosome partitioning
MPSTEQKEQTEIQDKMIADNLRAIKHRIVVFSGKGGVGKTTVSVNLAHGLRLRGYTSGILDADVTGPNVPKMLGLEGQIHVQNGRLVPQVKWGVEVVSIANAIPSDQPVIWRGPMRSKLLHQFLADVNWGALDYLVADLPPGTGDEIITMTQKMRPDLAVIVTTPQEMSLIDSGRAINMAKKMGIPEIGVIENMSGLACPECGFQIDLFGSGGGKKQAQEMRVSFLGSLPIDVKARKSADEGKPMIVENAKAGLSPAMLEIISRIERF